jgi:hypothetical protein
MVLVILSLVDIIQTCFPSLLSATSYLKQHLESKQGKKASS